MANGKPPIVWHLDTSQIDDKFGSPPDRLTLVKWVMQFYENGALNLKETFTAFERICKNQETDDNIRLLLDKIKINADTKIEEIFSILGIQRE